MVGVVAPRSSDLRFAAEGQTPLMRPVDKLDGLSGLKGYPLRSLLGEENLQEKGMLQQTRPTTRTCRTRTLRQTIWSLKK